MSRKRYLCVRDFDALQHYKDRNPIWIKLYNSILEDYEFARLPDATKFHAIGLMLLASRLSNRFPDDADWLAARIDASEKIDVELLIESKFLEIIREEKATTNARKSKKTKVESASTEKRRRDKNKTHTEQTRAVLSPDDVKDEKAVCVNLETSSESNGHKSKFSLEECFKYVEICNEEGANIRNPKGLATKLHKEGKADELILVTLHPEQKDKPAWQLAIDNCGLCDERGLRETADGIHICRHTADVESEE